MQVKAAAIQMHKLGLQTVDLKGMPRHSVENFRRQCGRFVF
jgi:hypothetical protein